MDNFSDFHLKGRPFDLGGSNLYLQDLKVLNKSNRLKTIFQAFSVKRKDFTSQNFSTETAVGETLQNCGNLSFTYFDWSVSHRVVFV